MLSRFLVTDTKSVAIFQTRYQSTETDKTSIFYLRPKGFTHDKKELKKKFWIYSNYYEYFQYIK